MLNGLSLFSGIGGFELALAPWIRPVAYCEIDPYCQAVLLSRMADGSLPRAPIWPDVQTLPVEELPEIDIVYGGFPCQDISVAGARAGLDGKRSGLFLDLVRVVRSIRPGFLFLENVPAITSLGLDRVLLEITALGYHSRWTIVSAGELGAPHLRERWWLYSHADRKGSQVARGIDPSASKRQHLDRISAFPLVQADIWAQPASEFCRVDDGLSPKTHRLRALGNSVVPQAAREAFMRLGGFVTRAPP